MNDPVYVEAAFALAARIARAPVRGTRESRDEEIAARAGMKELVQLQRKGRTRGEESARFGPS